MAHDEQQYPIGGNASDEPEYRDTRGFRGQVAGDDEGHAMNTPALAHQLRQNIAMLSHSSVRTRVNASDRRAIDKMPGDDDPDPRTPEERAAQANEFSAAYARAYERANPSPMRRYLTLLAWSAGVLRALPARPTKGEMYLVLYQAKYRELGGLVPDSTFRDVMPTIARRIEAAMSEVPVTALPAAWTIGRAA